MNTDDLIIAGMLGGSTVLAGILTFVLIGYDVKGASRVASSLLTALLVGVTSLFVPWLPLLAFLAAAVGYLVIRRLAKPGLALAASGAVLIGGLSGAVALMSVALNSM